MTSGFRFRPHQIPDQSSGHCRLSGRGSGNGRCQIHGILSGSSGKGCGYGQGCRVGRCQPGGAVPIAFRGYVPAYRHADGSAGRAGDAAAHRAGGSPVGVNAPPAKGYLAKPPYSSGARFSVDFFALSASLPLAVERGMGGSLAALSDSIALEPSFFPVFQPQGAVVPSASFSTARSESPNDPHVVGQILQPYLHSRTHQPDAAHQKRARTLQLRPKNMLNPTAPPIPLLLPLRPMSLT